MTAHPGVAGLPPMSANNVHPMLAFISGLAGTKVEPTSPIFQALVVHPTIPMAR